MSQYSFECYRITLFRMTSLPIEPNRSCPVYSFGGSGKKARDRKKRRAFWQNGVGDAIDRVLRERWLTGVGRFQIRFRVDVYRLHNAESIVCRSYNNMRAHRRFDSPRFLFIYTRFVGFGESVFIVPVPPR